ncbi:MAG: histidine kinase [Terracidiphilus sp.]|jgi:two-component system sensor histidine kinase AlgZ
MNPETQPRISADDTQTSHGPAAMLLRAIWTVCSATGIIVLIFLSLGRIHLSHGGTQIVGAFVYSVTIAVPSMIVLNWAAPRFGEKLQRFSVVIYAMVLISTAMAGTFAAGLVLQLVGIIPQSEYWAEIHASLPFAIIITLMIGLTTTTYETMRFRLQATTLELRTRQVEQERAYKLLAEAQLSSLESRIHPHFLFNTLNSIAALIPSDPVRAEDTVGKLASLLRFSLNAHQSGLVPLSQELKIVRDYLEIEKTRFGARIRYEIAVPAALDDVKVPPLAVQSLVENAVKHVVSKRPEGAAIRITGGNDSGRIHLEVTDDGPGFLLDAITPEHGLGNLIARLELLFGQAGQLAVTRESEKTVVRISFPA